MGLRLPDLLISRRHLGLLGIGDTHMLFDWGSRNGTFVDGRRVAVKRLDPGDEIRIGSSVLTYETGAPRPRRLPSEGLPTLEHALVGELVARYRILALLEDSMGSTSFRAVEAPSGREVELRLFSEPVSKVQGFASSLAEAVRRAPALPHPRLRLPLEVGVQDGGVQDGIVYTVHTVQPWGGAASLEAITTGARELPPAFVLRVAEEVLEVLLWCLERGLIHGALHPGNILIDREGSLSLRGYEVGQVIPPDGPWSEPTTILWPPAYLPPERLIDGCRDHVGDLYALGCLILRLIGGGTPFAGHGREEVLRRKRQGPGSPPARLEDRLGARLWRVGSRLASFERRARYQSAAKVLAEIDRIRRDIERAEGTPRGPLHVHSVDNPVTERER